MPFGYGPLTPEEKAASLERLNAGVEAMKRRLIERGQPLPQTVEAAGSPETGLQIDTTTTPADCVECGERFEANVILMAGAEIMKGRYCPKCVLTEQERQAEQARYDEQSSKQAGWEAVCPDNYRDNHLDRIRKECAGRKLTFKPLVGNDRAITADEIWHRHISAPGVGIIGETGFCKTRLLVELLRKFHFEGNKVAFINAVHFGDDLAAAYENGAAGAERWMRRIEAARILLIDDLGKEKLTERVETTYYRVIETRQGRRLPIYFTANTTGAGLIEKWQRSAKAQGFYSDRAEPIVRRLREMTESVSITNP